MRRALILILLLAGMRLIQPLGYQTPASEALLTFGFLILAAYTTGEIARAIGIPKLVGYLIAGIIFGPSALEIVSAEVIVTLKPVSQLAVALIAFLAGAELRWREVRERGPKYFQILLCEMPLTFVVVVASAILLRDLIPALQGASIERVIVFALLFGTVLVAHSPAITLGLLTETHAKGPVARTTLGVVLVSDVALVILFAIVATVSRTLVPPMGEANLPSLGAVVWEIAGAFVIGAAIGGAVTLYLRFVRQELLLFGIIIAMLGAEAARLTHVELLLTLLVAGFVTENVGYHGAGEALRHAVERAAAPVFVVFFALSGAAVRVNDALAVMAIVAPIVLLRGASIWVGTNIGSRWAGVSALERRYVWMGLISQAGVALGLAAVAANVYPNLGGQLLTITVAVIAINELIGPILFRRALSKAGEIPEEAEDDIVAAVPGQATRA